MTIEDMKNALAGAAKEQELPVAPPALAELCKKRADIVVAIEARESEIKNLNLELKAMDEALKVRFEDEGCTSMKVPDLGSFIMVKKIYAGFKDEFKGPEAIERLKRHFPSLVQETVNTNTLSAFWRDAKESDQPIPDEVREIIKEKESTFFQWRRA